MTHLCAQLLKTMKAALLKQTSNEVKQCTPEKRQDAKEPARHPKPPKKALQEEIAGKDAE
jgi:hypothetical protein